MTILKIYTPKTWVNAGTLEREIEIKPIKVNGDINKVPIDKTYQNNYKKNIYILLEIKECGIVNQRLHSLYRHSKKGFYSVVCGHKCFFNEDITKLTPKG